MVTTEPAAKATSSGFNGGDVETEDLNRIQINNIEEINIDIGTNNNSIQIQEFLDQQRNEFITNQRNINYDEKQDQQTESQKHNNNSLSNLTTVNTLNNKNGKNKITRKKIISVATYNVRGINNELDQNNIIIEMQNKNIDILGLSETKLNINN